MEKKKMISMMITVSLALIFIATILLGICIFSIQKPNWVLGLALLLTATANVLNIVRGRMVKAI